MRARAWLPTSAAMLVLAATSALAEPKPKVVDIKPIRDQLHVFADDDGGIYVAVPGRDGQLFYGTAKSKKLYAQVVTGRFTDEGAGAWDISVWAPRVPELRPGSVGKKADGTFYRFCGDEKTTPLTELTGDKA